MRDKSDRLIVRHPPGAMSASCLYCDGSGPHNGPGGHLAIRPDAMATGRDWTRCTRCGTLVRRHHRATWTVCWDCTVARAKAA